jgi:hypothetical protein
MGGRYLDLTVAAKKCDPSVVLLSNSFLSNTTLNDTLKDINSFMTANPEEILVIDIVNDNYPTGIAG